MLDKSLSIEGALFDKLRIGFDMCLEDMLKKMIRHDSDEGVLTVKVDVSMVRDEDVTDETGDPVYVPIFKHKVQTAIALKSEKAAAEKAAAEEWTLSERELRIIASLGGKR